MKIKKILIAILTVCSLLLLIPMPHGGTIGGNFFGGFVYEVKTYFSSEIKEAREKESIKQLIEKN